ncbi:MAG: hypothetical protein QM778_34705 [Myxococcales bacterium]
MHHPETKARLIAGLLALASVSCGDGDEPTSRASHRGSGDAPDESTTTGSFALTLVTPGASGPSYRLRGATVVVAGANFRKTYATDELMEDTISDVAPPGTYWVSIVGHAFLEPVDSTVQTDRPFLANVISDNPLGFKVSAGQGSAVSLQFELRSTNFEIGGYDVELVIDDGNDGQAPATCEGRVRVQDCYVQAGYRVRQLEGEAGSPEVYVIGVYEGRSSGDSFAEPATHDASVHVERVGVPVTLVLSSYEAMNWVITQDEGVQLAEVIWTSFDTVQVSAPPGTPIREITTGDIGYGEDSEGSDTLQLLTDAAEQAGAPVTAFGGCYSASRFVIANSDGCDAVTSE